MNQSEIERRAKVIDDALTARSEIDVASACMELDAWVRDHPEDDSIRDAYEPLTLRQMSFASQRQARAASPALTGSAKG